MLVHEILRRAVSNFILSGSTALYLDNITNRMRFYSNSSSLDLLLAAFYINDYNSCV